MIEEESKEPDQRFRLVVVRTYGTLVGCCDRKPTFVNTGIGLQVGLEN